MKNLDAVWHPVVLFRNLRAVSAVYHPLSLPYRRLPCRQWALKAFNLWDKELAFIEDCIKTDVRNNSAWNQVSHDASTLVAVCDGSHALWLSCFWWRWENSRGLCCCVAVLG